MNLTASETLGILKASVALAPFLFPPGYALGWALNLFDFRQRRVLTRVVLAVPLSIAFCPMISYLLARFFPAGLWTFYAIATSSCVALLAHDLRRAKLSSLSTYARTIAGLVVLWMAGAIATLVDVQVGDKLFLPISTYDHSTRVAMMGAIDRHMPPMNPFFAHPAVPLRYHYLWMLLCDLPAKLFHLPARHLMYGGIVWCGVGLMCTIALGLRFLADDQRCLERKVLIGIALLGVTGLDILPTIYVGRHGRFWLADMEWWNTTQITSWAASLLWVPHHVAALIACFVGLVLLRHASAGSRRHAIVSTMAAGLFFASAAGLSIYVTFTFVVAIAMWMMVLLARRQWRELVMFAAAGVVAALCAAPFLLSLRSTDSGARFAEFAVRPFPLGLQVAERLHVTFRSDTAETIAEVALLPFNYLLELGFFLGIAVVRWRLFLRRKIPASENELAGWAIVSASFLVGTFVRSSTISANDLGFRCFLPAQLVLLLWGATIVDDWWTVRRHRPVGRCESTRYQLVVLTLALFLIVGTVGTAYEVFMIRMTPVLYDRWHIAGLHGLDATRDAAQRTFAVRDMYTKLNAQLPKSAIIQNNPATLNFIPHLLYSGHDAVAANIDCGTPFGGDRRECAARVFKIVTIFLPGQHEFESVCREYGIDVMIAQDTDPAWREPTSWIWTHTPLVANKHVRAFRCGASATSLRSPGNQPGR